jgi:uncharacterized membrane protein YGL010W
MRTIEERMAGYAAYHQDHRCQATHLFGVPMVFYSPLIPLGWVRWDLGAVEISLGMLILAAILIWYFTLDRGLATILTLISLPMVYLTDLAAGLPLQQSLAIFLALKLGGWVIQLVGHVFEGRRPALVDNLVQSLMGPLFVLAEVLFYFGLRKDLKEAVERGVAAHRFSEEQATAGA